MDIYVGSSSRGNRRDESKATLVEVMKEKQ
jgi:hypothetical protein